jgi:radical SAM protein with 4Fe4S-binding SPASM domain
MSKIQKEISPTKRYKIDYEVRVIPHKGKFIVIVPETANWIVLDSNIEVEMFQFLLKHEIQEAMEHFSDNMPNLVKVITQIEARHLESNDTHKVPNRRMQLYLTNACNLRCPHCYMFAGEKEQNELTTQEILFLIRDFSNHGGKKLVLTGGEVCLRNDLLQIVQAAFTSGLDINILSNGTLWTDDMISEISSYISKIQISIDGYNEQTNSRVRGINNYKKAISTAKKFLEAGAAVDIAVTPFFNEELKLKYKEYALWAKRMLSELGGAGCSGMLRVNFSGDMLDGRSVSLSDSEKKEYKSIIEKIYIEAYGTPSDAPFVEMHRKKILFNNCSYGNLTVSSTGDIYLCGRVSSAKIHCNIRSTSFDNIVELMDKAYSYSDVSNLQPCSSCELKYICGGGCRLKEFRSFEDASFSNTPKRECNAEYKEHHYDLLIRTNELLFE